MSERIPLRFFQQAAFAYLCEPVPSDWYEQDEEQVQAFIESYVWDPISHLGWTEVYDLISDHACALHKWDADESPQDRMFTRLGEIREIVDETVEKVGDKAEDCQHCNLMIAINSLNACIDGITDEDLVDDGK